MEAVDSFIIGFIFLLIILGGGLVYNFFFFRMEGEKCELEKDSDKYANYKYNDKKECVFSECKTGYKIVDGKCNKITSVRSPGSYPDPDPDPDSSDVALYCKETTQCLTGGFDKCGDTNIGRGKKCTAYNTVKLDGYTLCTDEQSALVPSGTFVGEYVSDCPVDCKWVKKDDEILKQNCEKKYSPGKCIPQGASGNLDTNESHTYFEGTGDGKKSGDVECQSPQAVSCTNHGLTSCPTGGTAGPTGGTAGPTGCGGNTSWSVKPKSTGVSPKHNDYFVPTNEYCKTGKAKTLSGLGRWGEELSPIVKVPITRCNNGVQETKDVKGRLLLSFNKLVDLGYRDMCYDSGNFYNCRDFPRCMDKTEVHYETCPSWNPNAACKYRFLWDKGDNFDFFFKGI